MRLVRLSSVVTSVKMRPNTPPSPPLRFSRYIVNMKNATRSQPAASVEARLAVSSAVDWPTNLHTHRQPAHNTLTQMSAQLDDRSNRSHVEQQRKRNRTGTAD